mmetsp:Transcript_7946/g.12047  ORF Transcript_7946/g.12047 Transcript_7946/m.12047 type:complete len:103 (+) Transcript_7946:1-309(+)
MKACMSGHTDVVEFLLTKGAQPIPNDKGFSPGEQYAMDVTASTKAEIATLLSKKLGSRPAEVGLSSRSKNEVVNDGAAPEGEEQVDNTMVEETTACGNCTMM